jgi:hypothetical protein
MGPRSPSASVTATVPPSLGKSPGEPCILKLQQADNPSYVARGRGSGHLRLGKQAKKLPMTVDMPRRHQDDVNRAVDSFSDGYVGGLYRRAQLVSDMPS